MSFKKEENSGSAPDFFEYDMDGLYELLGTSYVATFLIITQKRKRGVKKLKFVGGEVDYTEIGREKFDEYSLKIRKRVCRTWNNDQEKFRETENAYEAIMDIVSKTDIPHNSGEILSTIIIKMGLDKFCNFEEPKSQAN